MSNNNEDGDENWYVRSDTGKLAVAVVADINSVL